MLRPISTVATPIFSVRGLVCAGVLLGLCGAAARLGAIDFVPPTPEQTRRALGTLTAEPVALQRLLAPDADFDPIEMPEPGDWLAMHDEAGQSFYDFVSLDARRATPERGILYLQPIGEFPADASPSLEALREYAAAFFQLDVALLPTELTESAAFEPRLHPHTGRPQHRSTAILSWLRERLPDDAFCLVAVTMTDLYPAPAWNFVYGQASPEQRTGVFSFARTDPMFFGERRPDDVEHLMLSRSAKTLVHEIAHLFGLAHCIHFRCVQNGVNHQAEGDSRPHHACPICLRKLQHATGADLERRYRDLAHFYSTHAGWEPEEAWVRRQLAKLRAGPPAPPAAPRPLPSPTVPTIEAPPIVVPPARLPPSPLGLPDTSHTDPARAAPVAPIDATEPAPDEPAPDEPPASPRRAPDDSPPAAPPVTPSLPGQLVAQSSLNRA